MQHFNNSEPAPVSKAGQTAVWPQVWVDVMQMRNPYGNTEALLTDMHQRHLDGIAHYKVPLSTENGRRSLVDAYQEVLDGCAYFKQALLEGVGDQETLTYIYYNQLAVAAHVRWELDKLYGGPNSG